MKSKIVIVFLMLTTLLPFVSTAQNAQHAYIVQGLVTSTTDDSPLIGVNVSEVDNNNRVVNGTITDFNGHYVLKVRDPKDKLSISYIGFNKQIKALDNKKVINVALVESVQSIKAVEITATRKTDEGGYSIPTREIGSAMQTLNTKDLQGIQVSNVGEALQGRIAGLDIVANSGDPGSGAQMRIRGVTSITGSSQPLIVVNGVPYNVTVDPNFDFASANQEQYANMLSINPDDIASITVLKDAAASAIWGSKGANGVLMITTKKGAMGKTRVQYSYRFTRTVQPKGLNMLNGGDFTMLMKEAYFNPTQNRNANNIEEYNYDQNWPEYQDFNNNTDWVKAVTQVGNISDHYLTLSGGGERANYRVSVGYKNQRGTILGQKYDMLSSRAYLQYNVSDRIRFITDLSLTNSTNHQNYYDTSGEDVNNKLTILGIAYRKMPNVSIYAQDANGNSTGQFFNIPRTSQLSNDQKFLRNPVAVATLASNIARNFRVLPTFRLQYDLLNPEKTMLRYQMYVSFDINNTRTDQFLPQAVSNLYWNDQNVNRSFYGDNESLNIYTDNNIAWQPKFANKDNSFLLYGSFQLTTGSSSYQSKTSYSLASSKAVDAPGFLAGASTSHTSWRSLAYMVRSHYAYKERYIIDGTFRRDGSTKFGNGSKFGNFPGLSLKWIISDEPFMKSTKNWLSMLAFRPSWGISGNQPSSDYLYFSKYATYGTYLDMTAIRPLSLRLSNLKWETTKQINYGVDLGLFDNKYVFDINFYRKHTTDLLFPNVAISNISGYSTLPYINGGAMNNNGWEINLYANRFVHTRNFSIDFRFDLSNYVNTLVNLDPNLLASYNSDFTYTNGTYLTRVQNGNSFGSIYGFRYKGVYQYDKYIPGVSDKPGQSPVARDASGNVIFDQNGNPRPMYFAYGTTSQYKFRGGDAIYEDVNHDGSIDQLDIVYLGNSNPKLSGGFGPTFRYKNFSVNMFFNFRYGNKIINMARMNAENMYYDNNQSVAVNWRWRKDGDITQMPRALFEYGYNWLGSDRYVEDGSFLRFKYLTFNYTVPKKVLKPYKLDRLSLYLTFDNVYVWTKYTGVDPEVAYGNLTTNQGLSIDNSATPRTKDFTLGVTVGI